MKIRFHRDRCYACGTCSLICSFHHTGSFWPERSSITVTRNPQDGSIKWRLNRTCNRCADESEPQCVKYCVYDALTAAPDSGPEQKGGGR